MSTQIEKFKKQLLADKKKLSIMISLSAVMLLLWGRLLLKQDPRTAVAEPSVSAVVDAASDSGDETSPTASQFVNNPTVELAIADELQRDLFRFEKDRYPLAAGVQVEDELEKSPDKKPDEKEQIEAIRTMASQLRFQAAMLGPTPRALINDRIYRLGDKINNFRVTKIESRRVVLENGGIEIHLEMSE